MAQMQMQRAGVEVEASNWNNRIREAVMKLSSKVPEVGAVVSILVGFLWPVDQVDIFQALKADVIKLVKQEILNFELNQRASDIRALKTTIERYKAALIHEKGGFLTRWISEGDRLSEGIRGSNNDIHLLLPLITVALLHLAGLRERLDFGKQIYQEDNTKVWKEALEKMYKTYIVDSIPAIFKKWKSWRAQQVEITPWTEKHVTALPPFFRFESHATVVDTITGERQHYSVDLTDSKTVFANICADHKTRMCNDASADMAGCVSTTFVFDKLLPADVRPKYPKYDKQVFGRMFRGPYSQDLLVGGRDYGLGNPLPIFRSRPDRDDYSPNSGPITKMIVREWNTIDAMQFMYANRQGQLAGNAQGGQRHEIDVTGKIVNGLRMGFSNGLLTYVQIKYGDGTSSSTYGNRSGWQCYEATAKSPTAYKASSWSCKVDRGPSNTSGPSVVQLEYAPQIE